jgi:hypothetical protein
MGRLFTMVFVSLIAVSGASLLGQGGYDPKLESKAAGGVVEIDVDDLETHPPVEETAVKIKLRKQQSIMWKSDKPFKIIKIVKVKTGMADQPFHRDVATMCAEKDGDNGKWLVASGPPKKGSDAPNGEIYKPYIQYTKEEPPGTNKCTDAVGEPIDPHISIHTGK